MPNSTFVVDVKHQKTALFPKKHILEYDFMSSGRTGHKLLDSIHYDNSFSLILDAILKPCRTGLMGQNVKVQQNRGFGGCFPIHYDSDAQYDNRAVTCILYLNVEDIEGGELVLYPRDDHTNRVSRVEVAPIFNRMAIFKSQDIPHRVLPCFSDRYCLTIWCSSNSSRHGSDTAGDRGRNELRELVASYQNECSPSQKEVLRRKILRHDLIEKIMVKIELQEEWRQSLVESHEPSPERDLLLELFDSEMAQMQAVARLVE